MWSFFKRIFTQADKLQHIVAGEIITDVGIVLSLCFSLNMFICILIGAALGCLAGVMKEFVWDKRLKKGTFNLEDMYATFIGSGIIALLQLIVFIIIYIIYK